MAHADFSAIQACVFGAYGTLFDVRAVLDRERERLGPQAGDVAESWRQMNLSYAWLRSLMQRHADFWQVTQDALDHALAQHGLDDPAMRQSLLDAYQRPDAYPDAAEALRRLRERGLEVGVLSNGTPEQLEAAGTSSGLSGHIDVLLSAEEVGAYKPDPRVYQLTVDRLMLDPPEILYISSNAWDVVGAAHFGLHTVWLNRDSTPFIRLDATADAEISSLTDLPPLLGA